MKRSPALRKLIRATKSAAAHPPAPAPPARGTLTAAMVPISMNTPTKKETREQRHTAKRLAEINEQLSEHISKAPRPTKPPILHIVAAFGLDSALPECQSERQHKRPWASLDAKDAVSDIAEHDYNYKNEAGGLTREEVLWRHVRPLLRRRLFYRVNGDLLPAWKQDEMKRLARLTGFDYSAAWEKVCRETLPPPKSWGADIDPITLEPTTLLAKWKAAKKVNGLEAHKAAAKTPSGPKPGEREKRKEGGVTKYLYPCRLVDEDGKWGPVQPLWFTDAADAKLKIEQMVKRQVGRRLDTIVIGAADDVTLVKMAPLKKAA
jgi:hypothetical protein